MKRIVLVFGYWCVTIFTVIGQCSTPFQFNSQADIDAFSIDYPGCTTIISPLIIAGEGINNLDGFSGLTSVLGNLIIQGTSLSNLTGIDNLTSIGGSLLIKENPGLLSLSGLENLQSVGLDIEIFDNTSLSNFTGLNKINIVGGDLNIVFNNNLLNLNGLDSLSSILGEMRVEYNFILNDLTGLQHLNVVGGGIFINSNSALNSLSGLNNLTSIGGDLIINGNNTISSLTGLESLINLEGNLNISNNQQLLECAVLGICNILSIPPDVINITNNAPGCNSQEEVEYVCTTAFSFISGKVFVDLDCNEVFDGQDIILPDQLIKNANNNVPFANTDQNGNYGRLLQPSTPFEFKIDVIPGYLSFPSTYLVVTGDVSQSFTGFDFSICPDSFFHNLSVTLVSYTPPRPGFTHQYQICVENTGTYPEDAVLTFDFSGGASGDYVTITDPDGGEINGPTITWTLEDIPLFTPVCFTITVQMSPATPIGIIILPHAQIESADGVSEITLFDNSVRIEQTVVGSFDPNDKTVSTPVLDIADTPEGVRLQYQIRFQNTGNFPATFIEVLDTLESDLDIRTFEMIAASHPYTLSFPADNILKWRFDNINLPDSISDEPGSHGFVVFSIKTVPGLGLSDVVSNTASIYFDYNEPVITNTATTSFFVGLKELPERSQLPVFVVPNPTNGNTFLEYTLSTPSKGEIQVFNTQGILLKSFFTDQQLSGHQEIQLDLIGLPAGVYLVRVLTGEGMGVAKVVVR